MDIHEQDFKFTSEDTSKFIVPINLKQLNQQKTKLFFPHKSTSSTKHQKNVGDKDSSTQPRVTTFPKKATHVTALNGRREKDVSVNKIRNRQSQIDQSLKNSKYTTKRPKICSLERKYECPVIERHRIRTNAMQQTRARQWYSRPCFYVV